MFYLRKTVKVLLLCTLLINPVTFSSELNSSDSVNVKENSIKVVTAKNIIQDDEKLKELQVQIKEYLGDDINNVGLSYLDINSRKSFNINGDNIFLAASTVKVQMNMVLADMIQSGQVSEDEKLEYTSDMYEDGTGILKDSDLTDPLPIMLLSKYSIIHSDNIATNMIINRIGYDNLRDSIDTKIGHATDHSDNYITPNDETKLLNLLYKNTDNNPYYENIVDDMKNTDFNDRINLFIPEDIVAHKIGNYDNYVNDVGIIYTSQPFILSIYTNNLNNANGVIAHISKMIYDYQNS